MQAKHLTVKNIGILQDIDIDINKPLIIFYGDIKQGKTTILNSIKLLFGGGYSKDLIRHGQEEAFIKLELDNGYIKREWYIGKDNEIKSRQLEFVKDGKLVKGRIVDEISRYVNPFLLDQNYFKKMNKIDAAKYLLEIFNVDTADLDAEKVRLESEARDLRATIKAYGEIDLTEVEKPNVNSLKVQKATIDESNKKKKEINDNRDKANKQIEDYQQTIKDLEASLLAAKNGIDRCNKWLNENPEKTLEPTTEIEEKISNAKADEIRYEQYQKNLCLSEDKKTDNKNLMAKENRLREIKKESAARLKQISDKIPGLTFKDDGDFTYLNTASDMLSDSMIAELSSKLSALYPDGLKLELIDQGESWGKSIFNLIDHAKQNNRNVLVTKVGDKDAEIPEEVGVFVVENGKLK